ncbi:MAG: PIN domain-containing protein [Methanophagales archaeon]|nr:PIN domain-containing protein [Methanophagales archaeon]
MKLRIYIDTSVIGGCLDKEFQNASRELIQKFKQGEMTVVISELTTLELKDAPQEVRDIVREIPEENIEYVELTEEAVNLARKYIAEGVIGKGKLVDAEHIAMATINRVDVLVSWNFRHIVNLQRIRGYNSVNLKYGYPLLEIRSPLEVITYEE